MIKSALKHDRRLSTAGLFSAWTRCGLLFDQTVLMLKDAASAHDANHLMLDAARLEPRILLSATPIAPAVEMVTAVELSPAVEMEPVVAICEDDPALPCILSSTTNIQTEAEDTRRVELVVIDSRLENADSLIEGLSSPWNDEIRYEVLRVDSSRGGLEQITDKLSQLSQVDAVHLFSHGAENQFLIGATLLSNDNIETHSTTLLLWRQWLSDDADLLIYGCDVAGVAEGQSLVARIAELTGADVAASADATGQASLGGDWDLEFAVGAIDSALPLHASVTSNWNGLLQAISVTTVDDVLDGDTSSISALLASPGLDGVISLREAIIASNQTLGSDVILLDAASYVLAIAGAGENSSFTGDLDVTDDLEIVGNEFKTTIIDGGGIDRVFSIRNNANVTFRDLTITGGDAGTGNGGGIEVLGSSTSLTLNEVVISANTAASGAGLFVDDGNVLIRDSTISDNHGTELGGGIFIDRGNVALRSTAVLRNSATIGGGGIANEGPGANLSLTNVTVSGNSTSGEGGGIDNKRVASILHSTIAYNTASSGGGIFLANPGSLSIQNSILANNIGGNANTTLIGSLGNNLSNNASGGLTHASDIIIADPKLGVLGHYGGTTQTIAILSASAAINRGAALTAIEYDQRGERRDVNVDIGAFEYQRLSNVPEYRVNQTVVDDQETAADPAGSGQDDRGSQQAIAVDINGNYVIVWESENQDGSGLGIFARRFDASGIALTNEIQVNSFTAGNQQWARVATDNLGNFVVTWTSESEDGTPQSVYARRFGADGTPLAEAFRVNVTSTNSQSNSVVAMDRLTGEFVIAWEGNGPSDSQGIFFRRFNADGTAKDLVDRRANQSDRGVEFDATIAMLTEGEFVIAWVHSGNVFVQRFASDGSALGGETTIDAVSGSLKTPALASDAEGGFVVVTRLDGVFNEGLYAVIYRADGAVRKSAFAVDTGDGSNPTVAFGGDGDFIVAWDVTGNSGNTSLGRAVLARKYSPDGVARGAAFLINQTTTDDQHLASIAVIDAGNYVVAWSGNGPGDSDGIFARNFGTDLPINESPLANAGGPYTIAEGGDLALDASGSSDPDGTISHYRWDLDGDGQFDDLLTQSATLTWAQLQGFGIDRSQASPYSIVLQVVDNQGWGSTSTALVTVTDTAPSISISGSGTATVGQNYTITFAATDPGVETISQWTVDWGDGSPLETFAGTATQATHQYTAASPRYEVILSLTDGDGTYSLDAHHVAASIAGPSISPIADLTIDEDTSSGLLSFVISHSDPASLTVTASSSNPSLIANDRLILGGTGENRTLEFLPNSNAHSNAHGTATLTVTVSDGSASATETFDVIVSSVNDKPIAVADAISISSSATVDISIEALLANDIDVDGDAFTDFELVTGPSHGIIQKGPQQIIRYRQTNFSVISDSFTYRVFDGLLWSDPVAVTLQLPPITVIGFVPSESSITSPAAPVADSNPPSFTDDASQGNAETVTATDVPVDVGMASMASGAPRENQSAQAVEEVIKEADLFIQTTVQSQAKNIEDLDGNEDGRRNQFGRIARVAAVEVTTEPDKMVVAQMVAFDTAEFAALRAPLWEAINTMKQDVNSSFSFNDRITVGAAATTTAGMTVGYVVWVLRSGLLLSSVMTQLPMWRFMDPLTILDNNESRNEEDDETLGSIAQSGDDEGNQESGGDDNAKQWEAAITR